MKKEGEESRGRGPVLWKLLLSTLYISAFTFGGGFVISGIIYETEVCG